MRILKSKWFWIIFGWSFVTGPGAVDAWLSLFDRVKGDGEATVVNLSFTDVGDLYTLFFPAVGLMILVGILFSTRKSDAKTPSGAQLDSVGDSKELELERQRADNLQTELDQTQLELNGVKNEFDSTFASAIEQKPYANLAHSVLSKERDSIASSLDVDIQINLSTIYIRSTGHPYILFTLNITSKALHILGIGDRLEGDVSTPFIRDLGRVEKLEDLLRLSRNQFGMYHFQIYITESLRDRLIQELEDDKDSVDIEFNLYLLKLSVELFDPTLDKSVGKEWLPFPEWVTGVLHRTADWDYEWSVPKLDEPTVFEEHEDELTR